MSEQYDKYIFEHKDNVLRAFEWIKENIPEVLTMSDNFTLNLCDGILWDKIITDHDDSKFGDREYPAYDAYFYGKNKSHQVVVDFNIAFLVHIHRNPHHWQYWILKHDDYKKETVLDMTHEYIVEMICDWWSFSWKTGNLYEIFNWYESHKDGIILSPKTRRTVETILNKIKKKLDEDKD